MKGWKRGIKHNSGEGNPNSELTNEEIRQIRALRASIGDARRVEKSHPASLDSLSKRFGIKPSQLSKIALGRVWRHVT